MSCSRAVDELRDVNGSLRSLAGPIPVLASGLAGGAATVAGVATGATMGGWLGGFGGVALVKAAILGALLVPASVLAAGDANGPPRLVHHLADRAEPDEPNLAQHLQQPKTQLQSTTAVPARTTVAEGNIADPAAAATLEATSTDAPTGFETITPTTSPTPDPAGPIGMAYLAPTGGIPARPVTISGAVPDSVSVSVPDSGPTSVVAGSVASTLPVTTQITLPEMILSEITLSEIAATISSVSLDVSTPALSVPAVTIPAVTLDLSEPELSIPVVTVPVVTLPVIAVLDSPLPFLPGLFS